MRLKELINFIEMKKLLLLLLFIPLVSFSEDEGLESLYSFIIGILIFVGILLVIRLFGAWMLRINDVVSELQSINSKLNKIEKKLDKDS
tara:strand:+ start:162 stop:428 length:267 start_codon:yes stop_codon:yes gene_type:complete